MTWQNIPTGVENTFIVDETFKRNLHFQQQQQQQQQQSYFSQYNGSHYPKETTKADLLTKIDEQQRRNKQHLVKVRQSLQSNQPFIPMIAENEYDCQKFQQMDQHFCKRKKIQTIQQVDDHSFALITNEGVNQQMASLTSSGHAQHYYNSVINAHQQNDEQLQKGQFQLVNTLETVTSQAENKYDCQNIQSIEQHLCKKKQIQQLMQGDNHSFVRQGTNESVNQQMVSLIPNNYHSSNIPIASHQQHHEQLQKQDQCQPINNQATEQSVSESTPNFKQEFTTVELDVIKNILR